MRHILPPLAVSLALAVPALAQTAPYTVFFEFDSTRIDSRAQQVIDEAVQTYRQTGSSSISAVGHTDTVGSEEYNQQLSEARARAVAEALASRGVPPSDITIAGRGERDLAVQTGEGVREQRNRRVVVTLGQPQQPVAQAPAPQPEPVAQQPVRDRLSFIVSPYYGLGLQEDAEGGRGAGNGTTHQFGANLIASYDIANQVSIEAEQAFFWATGEDESWGGRSAIGANYVGLSHLVDIGFLGGEVFPYIGANFGGYYGGDAVPEEFFAGPEIGLRVGPIEAKVAYDMLFDRDPEDGIVSFTLGAGFRF